MSKGKILIITDSGFLGTPLSKYLESQGYDSRFVGDFYDATEQIKQWNPDCIITELRMSSYGLDPRLQGFTDRCEMSGWIFMTQYPEYWDKTIIYTSKVQYEYVAERIDAYSHAHLYDFQQLSHVFFCGFYGNELLLKEIERIICQTRSLSMIE